MDWALECWLGLRRKLGGSFAAYLAMMLPGMATLRVWDLPPDGVKTAVGFEENRSLSFWPGGLDWWAVFCFWEGVRARQGWEGGWTRVPCSWGVSSWIKQAEQKHNGLVHLERNYRQRTIIFFFSRI